MNKLQVTFVLVAVFALTGAHRSGKCNIFNGLKDFDDARFIGDWYVLSRNEIDNPKLPDLSDAVCMKCSFKLDSPLPANDGSNATLSRCRGFSSIKKKDGSELNFEVVGQSLKPRYGVKQVAFRKKDDDKWHGIGIQSVIATDYDNWAITYMCKPYYDDKKDSFETIQKVHVLGRKPELDGSLHDILKQIIKGFDLVDRPLVNTDNSGC